MTNYQRQRQRPATARARAKQPDGQRRGIMALYGLHAVEAALENPLREVARVMATENAARRLAPALARRGIEVTLVDNSAIAALLAGDATHQGVLAEVAPLPPVPLTQIVPASPLIALDQVCDPHNVGAILRSAASFGAGAVIAPERGAPAPSGVLAKAASGALEHVPYVQITNLARTLQELKRAGYWIVGLDGDGKTELEAVADRAPVVLVLGAEGSGLRRLTRARCDLLARISLIGPIGSLNVSNAAAVALYALTHSQSRT